MDDIAEPSGEAHSGLALATVFGGSGFLGRRIVKHLLDHGSAVRAAMRHSARTGCEQGHGGSFSAVRADILDHGQVAAAVSGASTVINAVSLYQEHGDVTFERVHVEAASRLAAAAREAGAVRYIQISGIGSNSRSASSYIRARGKGEEAVTAAFPNAIIVRPAVMTGSDDAFLTTIVKLLQTLPAYPLFGSGETRLQPVFVQDVAEAIAQLAAGAGDPPGSLFELGGPRVYFYRGLVEEISRLLGVRARLIPVPFRVWRALAIVTELVPNAPLTRNQVELMAVDNVTDPERSDLRDLGIEPRGIEVVVQAIQEKSRS